MGRNSRRRAKGADDFRRRSANKAERDKVLIVTEGEKTEPSYFRALISELNLTTAKVKIMGDGGSDPVSVVEDAEGFLNKDDDFEHVYLVFDRDGSQRRGKYNTALAKAKGLKERADYADKTIEAITSVPCFEVWYLFHARDNLPPYEDPAGGGSPQKPVISDLKRAEVNGEKPFVDYEKSDCSAFYDVITPKREDAKKRADRALKQGKNRGDPLHHENASTRVQVVVRALEQIAKEQES